MPPLRLGIIGIGSQGSLYAASVRDGAVPGAHLAAVCVRSGRRDPAWGTAAICTDAATMIAGGSLDAVIISTPHTSHADLAIQALEAGLDVLVDKPMASRIGDCQRILAAYARRGRRGVLATMHHQRLDPRYRRLRELLASGACGRVRRFAWTITDWFRTNAYFSAAPWRGTWAGEHGGLLINQCPHQLDLLGWLFGAPQRVRAHCRFGAHHPIQSEDEVHALLEYPDGMIGSLTASSGEAPGTNRLEIATDRGLLTVDRQALAWERTHEDVAQVRRGSDAGMPILATERLVEAFPDLGPRHVEVLANFTAACRGQVAEITAGADGALAVELANALLLSGWEDRWVSLPLDAERYAEALARRCRVHVQPAMSTQPHTATCLESTSSCRHSGMQ